MQNTIESYNARYIIAEHFDIIINEIDQRTEEIICKTKVQKELNLVNKFRDEQISMIESLKCENLKNAENIQSSFEQKWDNLIEEKNVNYNQKLDKLKYDLIRQDCVIVYDSRYIIGHSVWITKWFNNNSQIKFLRFFEFFVGFWAEMKNAYNQFESI